MNYSNFKACYSLNIYLFIVLHTKKNEEIQDFLKTLQPSFRREL